jgi:hypothetical protein
MKAAPLLRAWLHRLRAAGVRFHMRHRWLGWDARARCASTNAAGRSGRARRAVVLALGGGSWPQLGSDGAWVPLLAQRGVEVAPLRPANCGFDAGWSEALPRALRRPARQVGGGALRRTRRVVPAEAGRVRRRPPASRAAWSMRCRPAARGHRRRGRPRSTWTCCPAGTAAPVRPSCRGRAARSLSSHLQSRSASRASSRPAAGTAAGGGFRRSRAPGRRHQGAAAALIAPRPLAEAISSAGGVSPSRRSTSA